ncbi:MAG: hypothetical protein K2X93_15170 [Candidatus Obscuribacterales bacterium]|nr:hypothetical protein [Candidatus Obscuribacterales bacterium]
MSTTKTAFILLVASFLAGLYYQFGLPELGTVTTTSMPKQRVVYQTQPELSGWEQRSNRLALTPQATTLLTQANKCTVRQQLGEPEIYFGNGAWGYYVGPEMGIQQGFLLLFDRNNLVTSCEVGAVQDMDEILQGRERPSADLAYFDKARWKQSYSMYQEVTKILKGASNTRVKELLGSPDEIKQGRSELSSEFWIYYLNHSRDTYRVYLDFDSTGHCSNGVFTNGRAAGFGGCDIPIGDLP